MPLDSLLRAVENVNIFSGKRKEEGKMLKKFFVAVFFCITVVSGQTTNGTFRVPILPLSEIREGMKGVAKTVFRGSEPEEFNVEILGILPGAIGPKQDLIIGKISGSQVEKTAVFAGMSGSPVFIDGKLIGAIAYSFPFSKEPICGITPVEQMIGMFDKRSDKLDKQMDRKGLGRKSIYLSELSSLKLELPKKEQMANQRLQSFQPIATPLAFGGFNSKTIDLFSSTLSEFGFLPINSIGGSSRDFSLKPYDDRTLQPGASVGMSLIRGDYSITAFGTVTFRDGEQVYAFGHPFLNLGNTNFPMSEAKVVAIVPSIYNSFKLAVSDATVGSMTEDRNTGVLGKLGQNPKMIPVNLILRTSRGKTEKLYFEVVEDELLTPLLLNIAVYNAIISNERSVGAATIDLAANIEVKNNAPIKIVRKFTGSLAAQLSGAAIAVPTNIILRSGFESAEITRVDVQIGFNDIERSANLEQVVADKTELRKGEYLNLQAYLKTNDDKTIVRNFKVKIPEMITDGSLQILVGDADSIQKILPDTLFTPENLGELIDKLNKIRRNDRIYVFVVQQTTGAIIGSKQLPNLPPSVIATLNNSNAVGNFTPITVDIIEQQESDTIDYVVVGQKTLIVQVRSQ